MSRRKLFKFPFLRQTNRTVPRFAFLAALNAPIDPSEFAHHHFNKKIKKNFKLSQITFNNLFALRAFGVSNEFCTLHSTRSEKKSSFVHFNQTKVGKITVL